MRDVIGQRRLLERLGAQALRGDVAQGYELSGPRSIGKHTVALRLAQTLNCLAEPRVNGGCGTCLSCRKIAHGTHPDVITVTRLVDQVEQRGKKKGEAKNDNKLIGIEQIREMQMDLALRPLEGRRRIVIIDDAAELSEHAEVALLKTLEEPPSHAVLILVTPTPSKLLETIRSRIQPLPLHLVARAEIEAGLVERFGQGAARFAAVAAGRPGVAISLAIDEAARASRTGDRGRSPRAGHPARPGPADQAPGRRRPGARARGHRPELRAVAPRRRRDHRERPNAPRAPLPQTSVS